MTDNSDYTKARLNVFELFPDTHQSDTAKSLFETTFNRHLSKSDLTDVIGVIGDRDQIALLDLQVQEQDAHRQAFQLQPVLRTKIATVEHVMSYKDVLNELERIGVDPERQPKWANAQSFNFIPPVSIDKLINFRDYIWLDETNPNSVPQYITIKNYCATAQARVRQKILELESSGNAHTIVTISTANRQLTLASDLSTILSPGVEFQIENSTNNDGIYTVETNELVNGFTLVTVVENTLDDSVFDGIVTFNNQLQQLQDEADCICNDLGGCAVDQDHNDWSLDNKWIHRLDIEPAQVSLGQTAELPIIEYHPGLQLNEWTYTRHRWKYRDNGTLPFVEVSNEPTSADLIAPDFKDKWLYIGPVQTVAIDYQVDNPTPIIVSTNVGTLTTVDNQTYTFIGNTSVALGGYDNIRIYIDGRRSYGTFSEVLTGDYVTGIIFTEVQTSTDIVVYLDAAAQDDIGREAVEVRTVENDFEYQAQLLSTQQPVLKSLIRYRKREQIKDEGEIKYPLFDLFNMDGSTANLANPIFKYQEDQNAGINLAVQRRIKTTNNGVTFHFSQLLINNDNEPMYAFIDKQSIDANNPTGLQTIWRKGLNNEEYIPRKVNSEGYGDGDQVTIDGTVQTITLQPGEGDWEIPDTLFFNSSHNNRRNLTTSELVSHFRDILLKQDNPTIFFKDTNFSHRLVYDHNYGVGGIIKEYNDSYDTLLSAIFNNNTNPIAVIEFAKRQYASSLNNIADFFRNSLVNYLLNDSVEFLNNQQQAIIDSVISRYETNDAYSIIYGDSNTYNSETDIGIKNWIITLPFIEQQFKVVPILLQDEKLNIIEHRHHDNHLSTIVLSARDINITKKDLIATQIAPSRKRGWTDTEPADGGVPVVRLLVPYQRLFKNDYWLEDDGTLYRFEVADISPSQPSSAFDPGSLWLRSTDGQMHYRDPLALSGWSPTGAAPGDISEGWKVVDLNQMLQELIQAVEQNLYTAAPTISNKKFSETDYILDAEDQALYNDILLELFLEYTRNQQIINPFAGDFVLADPFTWNYKNISYDNATVFSPNISQIGLWANRWHSINELFFNTPYPHLEPWALQGYVDKPTWWDINYKDPTNTRRWVPSMWTDIMAGTNAVEVPPNPITYDFVSVNITSTTEGNYAPDDLLPPFDGTLIGTPLESQLFIRNVSAIDFNTIDDDYLFGEVGPNEWKWRKSIDYEYDILKIAFRMQPMRFLHKLWGNNFISVADLAVDSDLQKVFSHRDTIFHGDLVDNEVYKPRGLNQWYINFNRSSNFDTTISDFRDLWTTWTAQLAYQTSGFINPRSFSGFTDNFSLTEEDRSIIVKKTRNAQEYKIDSLNITVSNYGKSKLLNGLRIPSEDASDWEFNVNATVPTTRLIEYYEPRNFVFEILDLNNGICEIIGSTLPWETGDVVILSTTDRLPTPVTPDPGTINQIEMSPLVPQRQYFIIKINDTQFKLASSEVNATNNIFIPLYDEGTGRHQVAQLNTVYQAYNGRFTNNTWNHHFIDKSRLRQISFPINITGLQNVLDFIDGYKERLEDQGFIFNYKNKRENDPNTGRLVNWQTEIERLIYRVYTGLGVNNTPAAHSGRIYNISVDSVTDVITAPLAVGGLQSGDQILFYTSGTLPAPLELNTPYYIIEEDFSNGQFKVATSIENAVLGNAVDILNNGSLQHRIGIFEDESFKSAQYLEVNPFRNNIWFKTELGIVSNMDRGPYAEILSEKTITDQYGRPFDLNRILFLREDKLTQISLTHQIPNDVIENLDGAGNIDPYNFIHMSGATISVDEYEHIIVFNSKSVGGFLIYDEFLGLRTPRFSISMKRQSDLTRRPSVGGFFLSGNDLIQNVEGNVENISQYYETHTVSESAPFLKHARDLLGFVNPSALDQINATEKTKFLFWRGMIQQKGSVNAINAFINSITFEDARVDEFWAYRIAEFGDSRKQVYPAVNIQVDDTVKNNIRFHFLNEDNPILEPTFTEITFDDETRWRNLPELLASINNEPSLMFDADISSKTIINVDNTLSSDFYVTLDGLADDVIVVSDHIENVDQSSKILIEGTHYTLLNSKIIKIHHVEIKNYLSTYSINEDQISIFSLNASIAKLNPSKLIDYQSQTVVRNIPIWDPARDVHTPQAINIVDVISDTDPTKNINYSWTDNKIGTIWFDTSKLGYVPYYDSRIYTNINDQDGDWGSLADWASITLYEWVESRLPPSEYAEQVSQQSTQVVSDPSERITGEAYQPLWKRKGPLLINNITGTIETATIQILGSKPTDLNIGDTILINGSLSNDGEYIIQDVVDNSPTNFSIVLNDIVDLDVSGNIFYTYELLDETTLHDDFYQALPPSVHAFDDGDIVDIYINGRFSTTGTVNTSDTPAYSSLYSANEKDHIHIVKQIPEAEREVGIYKNDFVFITKDYINDTGVAVEPRYYFWVTKRTTKTGSNVLSIINAEQQLITNTNPHQFFRNIIKKHESVYDLRNYYSQVIVRRIGNNLVNTDNRYELRFTRDCTFRDRQPEGQDLALKNRHEEWQLFRQDQLEAVPEYLWRKATDAVVGFDSIELAQGNLIQVPSPDRVLYDQLNGTVTRFGLRPGQAFIDKNKGITVILNRLRSEDFDPQPFDKFSFLQNNLFDTPDNIRQSMEFIYNNFPSSAVNDLFFAILLEAMVDKEEFPDLFKTSMIALHGIKVIQTRTI